MNTSSRITSTVALISVAVGACSRKPEQKVPDKVADSSQAMANMPGMPMKDTVVGTLPSSIVFTAAQVQHGGVQWASVAMGQSAGIATVPGEVTANEDRTARLGAPARGRVVNVAVRQGDRVEANQPLVTLQSPDAGMAQSDVSKAEAELSSRKSEAQYAASARARADRLLALKAIPRQDYDRAITDDERARAGVAQAEAEVRRAKATSSQLGADGNGDIVLRAPFSGVVLARTAVPGTVVDAGSPLVIVTNASSLWLMINAPEQMAALFRRGGRLRFNVLAYPADTFTATIEAVSAGLDADTRTLGVRAAISNSAGRLKPQMLATVLVEGGKMTQAVSLPDDAVQLIQGKPYAFIAIPDGKGGAKFERRLVVLGSRGGGRVAVLSGLASGDVVVTAGAFAVKAEFQKATMPKMEM